MSDKTRCRSTGWKRLPYRLQGIVIMQIEKQQQQLPVAHISVKLNKRDLICSRYVMFSVTCEPFQTAISGNYRRLHKPGKFKSRTKVTFSDGNSPRY